MFQNKNHIILLLSVILLTLSCANTKNNTSNCLNSVKGTLVNKTGLDGCGWMIALQDGKTVNPTNLNSFDIKLIDNTKITFGYKEKNDLFDTCMAGKIVEITCVTLD
ncbi:MULTISPECIES: hypothetical protein [unclassified Olleya]|jgi:hypothetical protein|uniref:hypothetical protein n=1 Tax=unclassified Olleya TaxID=2615019 RepID=UPI0011A56F99|nr:hypothetical protein [Olleya sp. Hel_I_94]TVZ49618.1 hypothetical protein JM82_0049 [Olleya sp. Hel_I_94]|tara:strand:- start:160616 stop:160936 length:321 start_codon:yes stop_codon:yes gene_type:complete